MTSWCIFLPRIFVSHLSRRSLKHIKKITAPYLQLVDLKYHSFHPFTRMLFMKVSHFWIYVILIRSYHDFQQWQFCIAMRGNAIRNDKQLLKTVEKSSNFTSWITFIHQNAQFWKTTQNFILTFKLIYCTHQIIPNHHYWRTALLFSQINLIKTTLWKQTMIVWMYSCVSESADYTLTLFSRSMSKKYVHGLYKT